MPILGAALLPHFPMLLKSIGGDRTQLLASTLAGIDRVSESIKNLNPDTLVVVSPHSPNQYQYLGCVSEQLTVDLKSFGDITHTAAFEGNYLPLFQLKKRMPKHLMLGSDPTLRYSIGLPLSLITANWQSLPSVTALYTSNRSAFDHVALGTELREPLETSPKSYYIIASGDFARYTAPSQDAQEAAAYADKLVLQSLKSNNHEQLLHPTEHGPYLEQWVCGIKPLCVLIGSIGSAKYTTDVISYEHSLGIGLMVATFELNR